MKRADVACRCAGGCHRREENWCCWGPQQLEPAHEGEHPEGAERSALEHLLNWEKDDFQQIWDSFCQEAGDCIRKFQVHVAAVLREQAGIG